MSDKKRPLTNKRKVFVSEYLKTWNAAESARRAGYSERSAREIGRKLLTNVDIKAEIDERLAEVHMSADEAMKLTTDIGRGDIGDFMAIGPMGFSLDLQAAREAGKTKLIKKVKQKTTTFIAKKESEEDREITEIEIELYDAQAAQRDVLKLHGKFTDKVEIQGGVEIITKRVGVDLSKV